LVVRIRSEADVAGASAAKEAAHLGKSRRYCEGTSGPEGAGDDR